MTAPDDLIRRDTAERAIRARQRDTEDSGIYAGLSVALQELAALPADRMAEAAAMLAEATEAHETAARVMDHAIDAWRAAPVHRRHELGLVADNAIELKARAERAYHAALHAYRAAVAARDAGTVSLAPAPAPSSGCHNDKPGDPCPCGANFERCPPAGTPPDGIVDPAPACARCGGSGEIRRRVGSDFAGYFETIPCPECRGKP